MKNSWLVEEGGRAHFVTERFDRVGSNGKLHMQTLCGMAHYDFNAPGAYSYEQAFNVMNGLHMSYMELEQMLRRVAFNVIVRNQDDHTKNISFLMDPSGAWSLSPAYDMGFNYNPDGLWTSRHQMSLNRKTADLTSADVLSLAERYGIRDARQILKEIREECRRWPLVAGDCGVPQNMIDSAFGYFTFE